jgi:hypothetical protein
MDDRTKAKILVSILPEILHDRDFWGGIFTISDKSKVSELVDKITDVMDGYRRSDCLHALFVCMGLVLYDVVEIEEPKVSG